jgi:hypothetical protein
VLQSLIMAEFDHAFERGREPNQIWRPDPDDPATGQYIVGHTTPLPSGRLGRGIEALQVTTPKSDVRILPADPEHSPRLVERVVAEGQEAAARTAAVVEYRKMQVTREQGALHVSSLPPEGQRFIEGAVPEQRPPVEPGGEQPVLLPEARSAVTVYLPEEPRDYHVATDTGDMTLNDVQGGDVTLSTETGKIGVVGQNGGSLDVETGRGRVVVHDFSGDGLRVYAQGTEVSDPESGIYVWNARGPVDVESVHAPVQILGSEIVPPSVVRTDDAPIEIGVTNESLRISLSTGGEIDHTRWGDFIIDSEEIVAEDPPRVVIEGHYGSEPDTAEKLSVVSITGEISLRRDQGVESTGPLQPPRRDVE